MTEPAAHRRGEPSPLALHLGAAVAASGLTLCAPGRGAAAVAELRDMLRGIELWQHHAYRRVVDEPAVIWEDGSSRLLDYGTAPEAADAQGVPVLVVPSLINRAYVLDLMADRSMLRGLAARGVRPFLLDWGAPGAAEQEFDLNDYASLRLTPALAVARAVSGRRVGMMGYCMGGTLAAGLAARVPQSVAALVTLGAPWDFERAEGTAGAIRAMVRARGIAEAEASLDGLGQMFGYVPVAAFQTLFALVDPLQAAAKFAKLARMDAQSEEVHRFVALEDWLADGVPMAVRAARDLLIGWQIRDAPATGHWRLLGGVVDPRRIVAPTLVVYAASDRIAPPGVAAPLAAAIPGARTLSPATGHVGMVVGAGAEAAVWGPVAEFLHAHAG